MCNARNHPPGCTCGWGGDGHSGVSPGGWGSSFTAIQQFEKMFYGIKEGPSYAKESSYIDPNAVCPVCGAPVFFYQSPFNGRVFFDSMGPPWPKHPCTDTSVQGKPVSLTFVRRLSEMVHVKPPIWRSSGWQPFLPWEIRVIPSLPACIRIKGTFGGQGKELFLNIANLAEGALLQVRRLESGAYELSIMSVDAQGVTSVVILPAWDNVSRLMAKVVDHKTA